MRDTRYTFPTVDWLLIKQLSSLTWSGKHPVSLLVLFLLAIAFVSKMVHNYYHQQHDGVTPPLNRLKQVRIELSSRPECIFCEKIETNCEYHKTERAEDVASWKNKENSWQQIAPHAEKMGLLQLHRLLKDTELFGTPSFFHEIFRHCIYQWAQASHVWSGKRYHERSRVSRPRDSVYLRIGVWHNSCLESVRYPSWPSLCFVYIEELTRNAHDNSNYRSEKRLKRIQNDSTMDLISFTCSWILKSSFPKNSSSSSI